TLAFPPDQGGSLFFVPLDLLTVIMCSKCSYNIQIIGVTGLICDIGANEFVSARTSQTWLNIDASTQVDP
ncbi:MAG: hypothetical protein P4L81_02935, partial [Candidatus Pacebacteria bacterium]|nr:hypothetical protein [Candidatus Paceibacterota bacterium]